MRNLIEYLWAVVWGWQGLALAVLGLNELSNWLFGRSWKWLHKYKWRVAVALLVVAQASLYVGRAPQVAEQLPAQSPGVIAENPDHAGLTDKLEKQVETSRRLEKERDDEKAQREAAEKRVRELEADLATSVQRTASCDRLAKLSGDGRGLIPKLRTTRAAPETRKEIDSWYLAVCEAMTGPQCEAFRGAPPAEGGWVGYPTDDGGYSQTLRGRTAYLSAQLARLCS